MAIRDLMPRFRRDAGAPVQRGHADPFVSLQHEVNRLFDDFWRGFHDFPAALTNRDMFGIQPPRVDLSETNEAVGVTAELPGLTESDVQLTLSEDGQVLTIQGENKNEQSDEQNGTLWRERSYGRFRRDIALPAVVDESKAQAEMKNGVLNIMLPKKQQAEQSSRQIKITSS